MTFTHSTHPRESKVHHGRFIEHWAVLLPLGLGVAGTTVHFVWCRRHGIDPIRATPARKYYELRGRIWPYGTEERAVKSGGR